MNSGEVLEGLTGSSRLRMFTDQLVRMHTQAQLMELQLLQLMHEYASCETTFGLRRYVADEIGLLLGLSSRSAELMLTDAELLMAHPAVIAKVAEGGWTLKHAHAALTALAGAGLDPEQQEQAVALVLSQGARTPWEVRKAMQAAILVLDPEAAARRHEKAVADRGVSVDTDGVGGGTLFAHASVSQVRALMSALEAQVGPAGPAETRSRAQRLFDALMDLVCGRVEIAQWQAYVVMSLDTLTGASQEPAEIPGLGLISAHEARELASRADLRRIVVDERGQLVSIDSTTTSPDSPAGSTVAGAAADAAGRVLTSQVFEAVTDAPDDISAADRAWHHTQLDQPTEPGHVDDECAAGDAAAVAELPELLNTLQACPQAFDHALTGLLNEQLARLIVSTLPSRHHGDGDPGGGGWRGGGPGGGSPGGGSPGGGGDKPPGPPAPPAPPARPGEPELPATSGLHHRPDQPDQLDQPGSPTSDPEHDLDVPPTAGDLAWADETTDYRSFDAQVPPRRYQREPGSRQGGAAVPTHPLWSRTGLRAALTTITTAPLDTRPLSSTSYALPPRMSRHIKARDTTCTFPGCHKLAQVCQHDHVTPWPIGKTEEANIASECIQHHQAKTARFFTVAKDGTGVHWTTRDGRTHTRPPRPLLRGW